ncbi:MAG: ArsR/SmtB family transcription factor [Oceanipulchritudo sp.]|jgi:DNA-binding transcriptional ArsR family regulator
MSEGRKKEGGLRGMAGSAGVAEATAVMGLLSHPDRLKVLCHLTMEGELSVGELLERIELSGSALSQHLAKLRGQGLVATRKERQTVYYRVGREDVGKILETLYGLYCEG